MKTDFTKYYTPIKISSALVKLLDFKDNCKVVDICCGSGNLLCAAKELNETIVCKGVDINRKTYQTHIDVSICDGREYSLSHKGEFDFALANPPFGYNASKQYTSQLFCNEYANVPSGRIEIEMLIANLNILKDTGVLLIIVPTTIVSGISMINFRKILAKNHSLYAIVDLPQNAFSPEKIKCSALIIIKAANVCNKTKIFSMDESYAIHEEKKVESYDIEKGNWFGESAFQNSLNITIKQGTISSQMFEESGTEVLHTGKKALNWQPTIRFANIPAEKKCVIAESGDVLISRIGASAGQKCVYQGIPRYISDCLLIIKPASPALAKAIMNTDLRSLVSGLSTPHITAKSITAFLEQTLNEKHLFKSHEN